jgi:hypothetical protein
MEAALRVEDVGEAEQIVLVGAAAVVEDEQACGITVRRTLAVDKSAHVGRVIGATLSARVGCRQVSPLARTGTEHDLSTKRQEAGMRDARIGGISLGGILVIVGIVLAILLGHWWIGLIIAIIGLIFFGGFARGKWY